MARGWQDREDARKLPRNWPRLRRAAIRKHPMCHVCRKEPSTEADHIIPRNQGGTDHPDNIGGICHPCHVAKTGRESGQRRKQLNAMKAQKGLRPTERHPGQIG